MPILIICVFTSRFCSSVWWIYI